VVETNVEHVKGSDNAAFFASQAFTAEQVRVLFLGLPALLFANFAVALVYFTMNLVAGVSKLKLLTWLAIIVLVAIVRMAFYFHFRQRGYLHGPRFAKGQFSAKRWRFIFRIGVLMTAIAWGIGGYMFVRPNDPVLTAFAILTIGGMCAGSVNALSVDQKSALIFLLVTPLPPLFVLLQSQAPGAIGLGLFFIVGVLFVALTSNGINERLLELIQLRFESEQKEHALAESEQRWKFALEGARQAVWDWDIQRNEEFVSERWPSMLGYDKHDEFPHGPEAWSARVHPEDLDHAQAMISEVLQGRLAAYDVDYRYRHKNGHWIWVNARGIVVSRDAKGQPTRMIGTREDITETLAMRERLLQSEKMQTIGQLAGGVAHDFNNNLTAMMMSLDMLHAEPNLSATARETINDIGVMADRAATITSQLLAFARRKPANMRRTDLARLLKRTATMLGRLLGEQCPLKLELPAGEVYVSADADLLDQAVMNLALNARDAMPHGGEIRIGFSISDIANAVDFGGAAGRSGRFVCVYVQDRGEGMDDEVLKHLFEPFFTTKDVGKGTGLGLASVHGTAHQHNGWVHARSKPGQGSRFEIYLPLVDYLSETAGSSAALARIADSGAPDVRLETLEGMPRVILLAEDEPLVRESIIAMLKRIGVRVLAAVDGHEALALWVVHQHEIEFLLSDWVMPGELSGLALVKRIRADNPQLPVLLMSGYSSEGSQAELRASAPLPFLPKPFALASLCEAIRAAMQEGLAQAAD
jgi:PAS domain S-box-containing protein